MLFAPLHKPLNLLTQKETVPMMKTRNLTRNLLAAGLLSLSLGLAATTAIAADLPGKGIKV